MSAGQNLFAQCEELSEESYRICLTYSIKVKIPINPRKYETGKLHVISEIKMVRFVAVHTSMYEPA